MNEEKIYRLERKIESLYLKLEEAGTIREQQKLVDEIEDLELQLVELQYV